MVKIRLRRVGAKKQPSFRIVVADSRAPRDGRLIERIGIYNPRTEPETLRIDEERALYWLSVGAQPTESVTRLLKTNGTMARFERLRQGESLEALVAELEETLEVEEEAPQAEPDTVEEPSAEAEGELAEAEEEDEMEEPEAKAAEDEAEEEPEAESVEAGDEGPADPAEVEDEEKEAEE